MTTFKIYNIFFYTGLPEFFESINVEVSEAQRYINERDSEEEISRGQQQITEDDDMEGRSLKKRKWMIMRWNCKYFFIFLFFL